MDDESWAMSSLRITCAGLSSDQITARLGMPSTAHTDAYWAVNLVSDSSIAIDQQLTHVKDFIRFRSDGLRAIAETAEINLHLGWTPNNPQDGLALDAELVQLLASIGAYILIDTYTD